MKDIVFRLLEIVLTSMILLFAAPVMIVITALIVVDSGFPVFLLSPRIGKDGKTFSLFYFRTMHTGSTSPEQRLTRVGRCLRNYSLDHLPQLINILRGDLHWVGPRPMTPAEADMSDENYRQVLKAKPGVVSPAILKLGRDYNSTDFATKVRLENRYLAERSLGSDSRLIRNAVRAALKSRGNIKQRGEPDIRPSETEKHD